MLATADSRAQLLVPERVAQSAGTKHACDQIDCALCEVGFGIARVRTLAGVRRGLIPLEVQVTSSMFGISAGNPSISALWQASLR